MSTVDIRRGITQAKYNEDQATTFYKEVLILSIVVGVFLQSWFVFLGALIFLFVGIHVPVLGTIIIWGLSCAWGIGGYAFGSIFNDEASIVLGILAFLAGLATHYSAKEYGADLSDTRDRAY
jgi:hypothetical protein